MSDQQVLPTRLHTRLAAIGKQLGAGKPVDVDLQEIVDGLADLPLAEASRATREIAFAARLFHEEWDQRRFKWGKRLSHAEQLERRPELAFLFLCHFSGHLRQAALRKLVEGLSYPILLIFLAQRLNDWVPVVRQTAAEAAMRILPATSPQVIVAAIPNLFSRQDNWKRWTDEREILDEQLGREDVTTLLVDWIVSASDGPQAKYLRQALKRPAIDKHLERLATKAVQPSVRAEAVKVLATGIAQWQSGWDWKWIDKSQGRRVQVPRILSRPISNRPEHRPIIERASTDPAVHVRRAAMNAVMRTELGTEWGKGIARQMLSDPNPSVRIRAEFVIQSS